MVLLGLLCALAAVLYLVAASRVRRCAIDDKWLAITPTARNVKSAIQFCGSAIVNVPTGGRKKKLNTSMAASDVTIATGRLPSVAVPSTTSSSASATVVGLSVPNTRRSTAAMPAMIASASGSSTRTRRFIRGSSVYPTPSPALTAPAPGRILKWCRNSAPLAECGGPRFQGRSGSHAAGHFRAQARQLTP